MATLGSLIFEMGVDLARLRSDMTRGVTIVESATKQMERAGEIAREALTGIAAGIGLGLTFEGFREGIARTAEFGEHLANLSKSTGASVEQLSFLDFAAKQSGTSLDGLTSGIARLQRNLSDVAKGGAKPAAAALRELHLSAQELSKLSLAQQFTQIGEALNEVKNSSERAALGQAIIGKNFKALAPLIAEGAEGFGKLADRFVELGGVVSGEDADTLKKYADSTRELGVAASAAGRAIVVELAPALTALAKSAAENVPLVIATTKALTNDFVTGIKHDIAALGVVASQAFAEITGSANAASIAKARETLIHARRDAFILQKQLDNAETIAAQKHRDELDKILNGKIQENINTQGVASAKEAAAAAKKLAAEQERTAKAEAAYILQLKQKLTLLKETTELAKVQLDIAEGAASKFTDAGKKDLLILADKIDLQKQSAEVEKYLQSVVKERTTLEGRADEAIAKKRVATIESLRTPLEKYVEKIHELQSLGLGQEDLNRGVAAAAKTLADAEHKINKLTEVSKELGATLATAFDGFLIKGDSFSTVIDGIEKNLLRIGTDELINKPAAKFFDGLFKKAGDAGSSGGIGDFFSSIGSSVTGLFGGGKAEGGPVYSGTSYLVGERGPELFTPSGSGNITPHGGRGVVVNVNFQNPPRNQFEMQSAHQQAALIGTSVQKAMTRNT